MIHSPDGVRYHSGNWAIATVALASPCRADSAIANVALADDPRANPTPTPRSRSGSERYQLAITISLLPLSSAGDIIGYRRSTSRDWRVHRASLACRLSKTLHGACSCTRNCKGFGARVS